MKTYYGVSLAILILCMWPVSAFGQSNAQIENELVAAIKEVGRYSNYGGGYDEEKLSAANDVFESKLLKYTKLPATLGFQFTQLDELIQIATSDDGKFRIYSWDTETGGTMHEYSRVYQFQAADGKLYSKTDESSGDEGGPGSFVTDIFTVDAKSGKFYIVCSTFIGSTMDHYQSANLYKIKGETLEENVKLIKTQSGLTNKLAFEYNFFSVVDRAERPIRLINYDKKTKTLKIPVVIEVEDFPLGKVTNRFISYRFNGKYFVKVK